MVKETTDARLDRGLAILGRIGGTGAGAGEVVGTPAVSRHGVVRSVIVET